MSLLAGLTPLRTRNYALYLTGHVVSHAGTMLENTATSWLLYELTESPFLLGLGGLFRTVPIVLFALVGGALADRLPRRAVLLTTQSLFCVSSLALGALVLTGLVVPWHVYAFNLVNATLNAFDIPARHALFPGLVPRDQVHPAVNLNSMAARGSSLIGPAIAGILIARGGNAAPFFVNALSYLVLGVALLAMRLPPGERGLSRPPILGQVAEGLAYVRASGVLMALLLAEALVSLFGHSHTLLTVFARDVLQVGAEGYGLLRSSVAAGALLGMLIMLFARRSLRPGPVMFVSGAAYALAIAAFSLSPWLGLSLAILVVVGLCDAVWSVTRNTVAQLAAPEHLRGRVMSVVILVSRGLTPMADVQAGALIALLGPALAGVAGAGVIGASLAGAAVRGRRLLQSRAAEDDVPPRTAKH